MMLMIIYEIFYGAHSASILQNATCGLWIRSYSCSWTCMCHYSL